MRHFPWRELGYAVGFIVLMGVLYVGAYFAMVDRGSNILFYGWTPEYRFGGSAAETIFAPIHEVDRHVRAEFWDAPWEGIW
jgi:hypothetical protein